MVPGNGRIHLLLPDQRRKVGACFRNRTHYRQRPRVGTYGIVFVTLFLVELAEMIGDVTVLCKTPGCGQVFLCLSHISLGEVNPAKSVPVRSQRLYGSQIALV